MLLEASWLGGWDVILSNLRMCRSLCTLACRRAAGLGDPVYWSASAPIPDTQLGIWSCSGFGTSGKKAPDHQGMGAGGVHNVPERSMPREVQDQARSAQSSVSTIHSCHPSPQVCGVSSLSVECSARWGEGGPWMEEAPEETQRTEGSRTGCHQE